jgi:hypothetical protein
MKEKKNLFIDIINDKEEKIQVDGEKIYKFLLSFNILGLDETFGKNFPKKMLPNRKEALKEDKIDHNTQVEHIKEKEEVVTKKTPKSGKITLIKNKYKQYLF